jgi:hypothetical protein
MSRGKTIAKNDEKASMYLFILHIISMSIVLAGKPLVDTMVDDILTQKQELR